MPPTPHPLTPLQLAPPERELLDGARRAVLATMAGDGRPRLVPITFAADLDAGRIYTPLDEKPKSVADPRQLARVRDILARPMVSVLIDHWSEDWTELAWVRLDGEAKVLDPADPANPAEPAEQAEPAEPADPTDAAEHARAVGLLRARYAQYAEHRLEDRPIIRILVQRVTSWDGAR